jgi:pimeloyl-ACP methyl ester carboxylesterase
LHRPRFSRRRENVLVLSLGPPLTRTDSNGFLGCVLAAPSKKHGVALVPGFLGFDHEKEVTYYADRFIAGLRASIEANVERAVFVAPVTLPPIGSLAERQAALLSELDELDKKAGAPLLWHLVGHSTGGLDAALLARTTRLAYDREKGSHFTSEPLFVERLRSVTTLSAPHYGSCLARAPLPVATKAGHVGLEERIRGLVRLPALALDVAQRDALASRLSFARGAATSDSVNFFWHLLFADRLARDLDPDTAVKLTRETENRRRTDEVPVFSIASMAPSPKQSKTGDRLFEALWTWTQVKAERAEPRPAALPSAPAECVASDPSLLPDPGDPIEDRANDGVVNTNRQVFGKFAGLVLADHGDVLGRYRRVDVLDGKVTDPGLLTSGASFGDDEFFALLRMIARGIAGVMKEAT